jgi:hypothetical protein
MLNNCRNFLKANFLGLITLNVGGHCGRKRLKINGGKPLGRYSRNNIGHINMDMDIYKDEGANGPKLFNAYLSGNFGKLTNGEWNIKN